MDIIVKTFYIAKKKKNMYNYINSYVFASYKFCDFACILTPTPTPHHCHRRLQGIDFAEFTLHLFIGILFCIVVAYILLAVIYKLNQIGGTNKDAPHISELKREVTIWERTAAQVGTVSLEERAVREALVAKALEVRQQLKEQVSVTYVEGGNAWRILITLSWLSLLISSSLLPPSSPV